MLIEKRKEGLTTKKFYKNTAQKCRNEVRKAKMESEWRIIREAKSSKKDFFKCVNSKKKTKVAIGSQFIPNETVLTDDGGKWRDSYFASVFLSKGNGDLSSIDLK